jgi:hypothetical protein
MFDFNSISLLSIVKGVRHELPEGECIIMYLNKQNQIEESDDDVTQWKKVWLEKTNTSDLISRYSQSPLFRWRQFDSAVMNADLLTLSLTSILETERHSFFFIIHFIIEKENRQS